MILIFVHFVDLSKTKIKYMAFIFYVKSCQLKLKGTRICGCCLFSKEQNIQIHTRELVLANRRRAVLYSLVGSTNKVYIPGVRIQIRYLVSSCAKSQGLPTNL